tara:strand:+ start:868 stop:1098 length:231 start_codon:yes stop_codon:yes gene_type:complete
MLFTILAVSLFLGLFLRSFNAFMAGLFGLLFFFYPTQSIVVLLIGAGITFLIHHIRSNNNDKSTKHHLDGNRDIDE